MTIKESSDELNSTLLADQPVATARPSRSASDYLALAIATCGVGYLPLAPGTWGSLVALVFYVWLHGFWFAQADIAARTIVTSYLVVQLVIIAAVTAVGIWAASRTERVLQIKDPGKVVVDEVAGQLIALLPIAGRLWRAADVVTVIVAFVLFRLFDIVKPYPARKFESMRGGWGIMADDLVAGVYAALSVALIRLIV